MPLHVKSQSPLAKAMANGIAKSGPGRIQAQSKVNCALPIKIEKMIYSNITVKYSIKAVN